MPSKFLNLQLTKKLQSILGILDQDELPTRLHTDEVLPVVELGALLDPPLVRQVTPVLGAQTYLYDASGNVNIGGASSTDQEMIPAANGFHTKVLAWRFRISGPTDAGASPCQVRMYYQLPVGQAFFFIDWENAFQTSIDGSWSATFSSNGFTSQDDANPRLPFNLSNWDGYVPDQVPIRLTVLCASGLANFPVGTTLTWRYFVTRWPVGTVRPF